MCCGLWQSCPLLEFPTFRIFGSIFQGGDSTLSLWAGLAEIDGLLSHLGSPEYVWPGCHYPESVEIWESPMWAPQPWLEASEKIVDSAWKGRIRIPDVRNDRSCHCLSRLARTKGSVRHCGVNQFVCRPNE